MSDVLSQATNPGCHEFNEPVAVYESGKSQLPGRVCPEQPARPGYLGKTREFGVRVSNGVLTVGLLVCTNTGLCPARTPYYTDQCLGYRHNSALDGLFSSGYDADASAVTGAARSLTVRCNPTCIETRFPGTVPRLQFAWSARQTYSSCRRSDNKPVVRVSIPPNGARAVPLDTTVIVVDFYQPVKAGSQRASFHDRTAGATVHGLVPSVSGTRVTVALPVSLKASHDYELHLPASFVVSSQTNTPYVGGRILFTTVGKKRIVLLATLLTCALSGADTQTRVIFQPSLDGSRDFAGLGTSHPALLQVLRLS